MIVPVKLNTFLYIITTFSLLDTTAPFKSLGNLLAYLEMEMQDALTQGGSDVHGRESSNTLWSLVKDFCNYTSAHGMGRIMTATHWTRTVFWTMLLLGATTIMTIQVHILFQKFQERPLNTFVTVETSKVRVKFLVLSQL